MPQNAIESAEMQLKRVGMLEALTPELKDKLMKSTGLVEHSFEKQYDNDKLEINLRFRKSRTSEISFLNKFEATLKTEGESNVMKQVFYTPPEHKIVRREGKEVRHDNKYTMKEAYNLLAGRPVFKNLLAENGQEYQAWVKLNKKVTTQNGNHELKRYNQNYGFDLDKVLNGYPIKELANVQYKANLVESLHRGNLQKATFIGADNKEKQLYISPSLTTSSLNVHDETKKRIPLERLGTDGLISKELVDMLKAKFGQRQSTSISDLAMTSVVERGLAVAPKEGLKDEVSSRKNQNEEHTKPGDKKQRRKIEIK